MTGQEKYAFSFDPTPPLQGQPHFHRSFVGEDILFLHFSELDERLARDVLAWRNHPEIRKWMYNKDVISEEAHFRFLQSLPRQRQRYYWLVKEGHKNLGVIDLSNYQAGESEWGFYLNPQYLGGGKAFHLFHHALHLFFCQLRLQKVYGFVACQNTNSLLLNELFDMQLTAMLPRMHGGHRHWYARYELDRESYLQQGLGLTELRKKIINERSAIQYTRQEIAIRQILIQAFGVPILPWTISPEDAPKGGLFFPYNNLQLAHCHQLLEAQFKCQIPVEELLACTQLTDIIGLLRSGAVGKG